MGISFKSFAFLEGLEVVEEFISRCTRITAIMWKRRARIKNCVFDEMAFANGGFRCCG